ncbi:MAG: hypothetical protein HY694_02095 [Deltaproteobacteria bacterium]|nr:hypothetical protein [Deltaproteobacteria bacterium]
MRSRWFLWLVAVLIGTSLAFPPMISAAEKKEKKAAQPCAAGEVKKEEAKKEEKKAKKAAKKKAEKKKGEKEEAKQPCAPAKK